MRPPPSPPRKSFWSWLRGLFAPRPEPLRERALGAQEARVLNEFCRQYGLPFRDLALLKLALTHRSYLSVTGQGPRESNERLEFLGDSVLGLVTSEFLYRRHPDEHEGQLTKTKSLLVSKAILSRRALRIGLGRFVLMSHSEVESGGRQRLSILADAFESVIGAIYLDQGFEPARAFIQQHLLAEADAITSDKRHTNYKSHLQEYVQNAFRTHPVYRIRSEYGPDHSKHFMVEVMVGRRTLGEGRGHNKKEAEQAAARDALEKVEKLRRRVREDEDREADRPRSRLLESPERGRGVLERPEPRSERETRRDPGPRSGPGSRGEPAPPPLRETQPPPVEDGPEDASESDEHAPRRRRRRSRRGGRGRHGERRDDTAAPAAGEAEPHSPGDDREPPEDDRGDEPARARAEAYAERDDDEPPDEIRFDAPPSAPAAAATPWDEPAPAVESDARLPEPARTFGRGRRREPQAGATAAGLAGPGAGVGPEPSAPEQVDEERRVDVFTSAPPRADGDGPPVVDVASREDGPGEEPNRDRESRIEEMERALESFGRRRTSDYGRRGRRR